MSTIDGVLDFELKQGEQLALTATLKGATGVAVDLTGAAITFSMRPRGTLTPIALAGATAIVGPPANGTVKYTGTVADTARAGEMEAEFKVDWGGGRVQEFPDGKNTYLFGYITEKIA
jgi:hypothetical protein